MNVPPARPTSLRLVFLLVLLVPGAVEAADSGTGVTPPETVRSLVAVAGGTGDLATRTAAIQRLGEIGDLDSIVHILRISLRDPKIRRPSWTATTGILKRHPERTHYVEVYKLFNRVPPDTRIRLASCVASADSIHGARLLSDLLGPDVELDQALLSGLLRMTGVTEEPNIMVKLRGALGSNRDHLRRDAAHVLGSLKDYESIPDLIALLGDGNRAVREGAYWSLCNISGLSMPANTARWLYWYQQETQWWDHKLDEATAGLSSGNPARIVAAIHSLSQRTLRRDRVEALLRIVSDHKSESIRCAAHSALVAIGAEPDRMTLTGACGLGGGGGLGGGATMEMMKSSSQPGRKSRFSASPRKWVEPPKPGANWLIWLGGGLLIMVLLSRVLGVWSADRVRSLVGWWSRA